LENQGLVIGIVFQNKLEEFLIMNQVTLLVLMLSITRRMLN